MAIHTGLPGSAETGEKKTTQQKHESFSSNIKTGTMVPRIRLRMLEGAEWRMGIPRGELDSKGGLVKRLHELSTFWGNRQVVERRGDPSLQRDRLRNPT